MFWCVAHVSDLAIENVFASVPELKIWQNNLISVATFFRTSKNNMKKQHQMNPKAKKFPKHHVIRFAEHLLRL